MPELPEVEHLRRTLKPVLVGAHIERVRLHRPDIVRSAVHGRSRAPMPRRPPGHALLSGATITALHRHGKQLVMAAGNGRVLCVHLGMTGRLRYFEHGQPIEPVDHIHCRWTVARQGRRGTLVFRDPRRFGGLWWARSLDVLRQHCWADLGPDALSITPQQLHDALRSTQRAIKAALLDQSHIAGLGNIYADESLFEARINPKTVAATISRRRVANLHDAINRVLLRSLNSGGSTLRDYVDGNGDAGTYGRQHKVYGRDGQACTRCGGILVRIVVGQRSTVYCVRCQRR